MILNLNENDKKVLKELLVQINSRYTIMNLKKSKGHNLYEYNVDTDSIRRVCSVNDIDNGKLHPRTEQDCLYLFRLNIDSATKKTKLILTSILKSKVMNLKEALIRKGYSEEVADSKISKMVQDFNDGGNPEDILYEEGLEPDYVIDLINSAT